MAIVSIFLFIAAFIIALFVAYTLFHYVLLLLVSRPKDAGGIGHELNQFERLQLIEWAPKPIVSRNSTAAAVLAALGSHGVLLTRRGVERVADCGEFATLLVISTPR